MFSLPFCSYEKTFIHWSRSLSYRWRRGFVQYFRKGLYFSLIAGNFERNLILQLLRCVHKVSKSLIWKCVASKSYLSGVSSTPTCISKHVWMTACCDLRLSLFSKADWIKRRRKTAPSLSKSTIKSVKDMFFRGSLLSRKAICILCYIWYLTLYYAEERQ